MLEQGKKALEKLTGIARPAKADAEALVRARKPLVFRFKSDGTAPNNPSRPLVLYRSPVWIGRDYDPAAIFEVLFAAHAWTGSWRNGMYDFRHFHTRTHEALGIARGWLSAEFGGAAGKAVELKPGDVVVLPAGTCHRKLSASQDLLVVGAYPANSGEYDEPRPGQMDCEEAARRIAEVRAPRSDPVFGKGGPLPRLWQ